MKNKIKSYVDHYFRFDKREDLEALKAEITANLCDRYDEAIMSGLNEQEAYVKTVKSMGDFQAAAYNKVQETDKVLPSLPEYLLPVSAIFAFFACILIFLNGVVGGVLTAISIALYAAGGYYLYSKAMHVKAQDMDIERHNSYLKKIFKYMKTSFAFWSVNIAYLVALLIQLISNLIVFSLNARQTPNLNQINEVIQMFIFWSVLAFIVSFILLSVISYHIYQRLKLKYFILTGEKTIEGKIKESIDYIRKEDLPKSKDLIVLFSFVFGIGSLILYLLTHVEYTQEINFIDTKIVSNILLISMFELFKFEPQIAILMVCGFIWVILTYVIVFGLRQKKYFLYQAYIVLLVLYTFENQMLSHVDIMVKRGLAPFFIVIPAFLSVIYYLILLVLWMVKRFKK